MPLPSFWILHKLNPLFYDNIQPKSHDNYYVISKYDYRFSNKVIHVCTASPFPWHAIPAGGPG